VKPNVFMGYPMRGIVGVLNSFGDEQYRSKSNMDSWCLINKYPSEGIGFLVGFGRATQYPKDMLWNPMYFWDTLKRVLHVH